MQQQYLGSPDRQPSEFHNGNQLQILNSSYGQLHEESTTLEEYNISTDANVHEQEKEEKSYCNLGGGDNDTRSMSELNNNDNNNFDTSRVKMEPFYYDECQQQQQECREIPTIDLDAIINSPINGNEEYKKKIENTADEIVKVCADNNVTNNDRLPGFHQAFGSTEIGRYLQQQDFPEQIISNVSDSFHILQQQSSKAQAQIFNTFLAPTSTANKSKPTRAYNRRNKTSEPNKNVNNWGQSYDRSDTANGHTRRKETRRGKSFGNNGDNSTSQGWNGYGGRNDGCYNCPAPYAPTCPLQTDATSCDYYQQGCNRYQNFSCTTEYESHGYAEQYDSNNSSSFYSNQFWRNDRYYPYGEYSSYRCRQNSFNNYQSCVQQQQQPSQMQYNNYGYNPYAVAANYNHYY